MKGLHVNLEPYCDSWRSSGVQPATHTETTNSPAVGKHTAFYRNVGDASPGQLSASLAVMLLLQEEHRVVEDTVREVNR